MGGKRRRTESSESPVGRGGRPKSASSAAAAGGVNDVNDKRLIRCRHGLLHSARKKRHRPACRHWRYRCLQADAKDWGRYGILTEQDRWDKEIEFSSWLLEIKGMTTESLRVKEENDLWEEYKECYNTASLPRLKYYSMQSADGGAADSAPGLPLMPTTFDDETALRMASAAAAAARRQAEMLAAAAALKGDLLKAEAMRERNALVRQAALLQRAGMTDHVARLRARLRPVGGEKADDPDDETKVQED